MELQKLWLCNGRLTLADNARIDATIIHKEYNSNEETTTNNIIQAVERE